MLLPPPSSINYQIAIVLLWNSVKTMENESERNQISKKEWEQCVALYREKVELQPKCVYNGFSKIRIFQFDVQFSLCILYWLRRVQAKHIHIRKTNRLLWCIIAFWGMRKMNFHISWLMDWFECINQQQLLNDCVCVPTVWKIDAI